MLARLMPDDHTPTKPPKPHLTVVANDTSPEEDDAEAKGPDLATALMLFRQRWDARDEIAWKDVVAAYHQLKRISERNDMWEATKAIAKSGVHADLECLRQYWADNDRRRKIDPHAKAKIKERDKARNKRPQRKAAMKAASERSDATHGASQKRIEQKRAARKAYKERQRALKQMGEITP